MKIGRIFDMEHRFPSIKVIDQISNLRGVSMNIHGLGIMIDTEPYKEVELAHLKYQERFENYPAYISIPETIFKQFQRKLDGELQKIRGKGIDIYLVETEGVKMTTVSLYGKFTTTYSYEYSVPEDRIYDSIILGWPIDEIVDRCIQHAINKYKS